MLTINNVLMHSCPISAAPTLPINALSPVDAMQGTPAATPDAAPAPPPLLGATPPMKILVAEDEPVSRRVLQAALARLGHTCRVTCDGGEAWEAFGSFRPDVIISDRLMPVMDGQTLCRKVRAADADRKRYTYFVLLTGMTDRADILGGMRAGADDYLAKPLDVTQLEARLIAAERMTRLHRDMLGLNETLWALARRDMLTGLFNRLQLKEDLDVLREHIARTRKSWTIALCDVDYFKAYNDHYGHLCGDETLRRVAEALQGDDAIFATAAPAEAPAGLLGPLTAYRYGGEEFCLLVEGDGASAAALLEAARARVAALVIPHTESPVAPFVTVSIGLSPFGVAAVTADDANALLADADAALYIAKRAGRNRIAASR